MLAGWLWQPPLRGARPAGGVLGSAAAGGVFGGCRGGEDNELGAVDDVELGEDVGEVGLDGGAGDEQAVGDVGVGQAFGDESYHLSFGGGEAVPAVFGSLPWASAAAGVAEGGLGGQLPGLLDHVCGLASEGFGGPFAVGRDRCLVVAVLSHLLVQRAGGDQQAQPFGWAARVYG